MNLHNTAEPQGSSASHTHAGIAILLAMTMALGPLALDTYLPAFPAMAASLGVSVHDISLSISGYVFVLALGQLVAGPLSDRWGRGPVMLTGLAMFGLASYLISQTQTLESLLGLRMLQAFGGGWATVCVPALVRDRLSGVEAARFFSLIGLIMILAPAVAPSIGSLILLQFSWPAIFIMLCAYAVLLVLLLKWVLFPSYRASQTSAHAMSVWQRYRAVFATRPALRFMLLQTFSFAVMLLFITHSSFIYQEHYGASAQHFALLFGANIVVMMVANLINRRLLKSYASQRILRWSITLQATGILLLIVISMLWPVLWLFLPAMMLTIGAMGAITPNTQACFMEYFAEHGGTASALMGATQFSVAGLISAASALLPESVTAIILAMAACSLLCLILVWQMPRTTNGDTCP